MNAPPTTGQGDAGSAFTESRPVRRLGKALHRKRRLRVGVTQLVYLAAGFALGLLVPRIPVGYTVPHAETAQMLFAVGAGLVTFIGVVFSLLFLVVQFGSTTYTPRLNLFQSAPIVWHTFAFYLLVVVYSFVAAFDVGSDSEEVSALVPVVALLLLLVAVFLYRTLQAHAFESIKLASVLADIATHGHKVLDGVYPDEPLTDATSSERAPVPSEAGRDICWRGPAGVLQAIDVPGVIAAAKQERAVVEVLVGIGAPVYPGRRVAVLHGEGGPRMEESILGAMRAGQERTFEQDPTFAFRLLVDIALRALSPAVNDPTTAVQVLDTLEDLLRSIIARDLDVNAVTGPGGSVRVMLLLPDWDDYVTLSFEELIAVGMGHVPVRRRLERLLKDLTAAAPPSRRSSLTRQLDALASRRAETAGA